MKKISADVKFLSITIFFTPSFETHHFYFMPFTFTNLTCTNLTQTKLTFFSHEPNSHLPTIGILTRPTNLFHKPHINETHIFYFSETHKAHKVISQSSRQRNSHFYFGETHKARKCNSQSSRKWNSHFLL